jgi:hypothetical protein
MKKQHLLTGARAFVLLGTMIGHTTVAMKPADAQETTSMKDARTQKILGNQFRSGVYYYDTSNKTTSVEEVEREVNRMADMGFNYVYAAVSILMDPAAPYPQLDKLLEVCSKRGMAVRVQAGGYAYLRNGLVNRRGDQWKEGWSAKRLADTAVPFIKRYMNHPNVIDFLVMEEPGPEELSALHEYYQEIFKQLPDAPLMLLYNRLEVSEADKENRYPRATGSDIYPFRSAGVARNSGIRTPGAALQYYSSRMDAFQQLARHRGQSFEAVFASYAESQTITPEALRKTYYGHRDEAELQASYDRDLRLAKAGNRGLSLTDDGKVRLWFRYWAPPRYVTALSWISLARGADSMAVYHWRGHSERDRNGTKYEIVDMLGWDSKGSRGLDEFAAFAKKIRPFGKLMRSATRDIIPFVSPKNGDEVVQVPVANGSVLENLPKDTVWNSFSVPGYRGKVVVLANTLIGTWSGGKTTLTWKEEDLFRINEKGELIDYAPLEGTRSVEVKVVTPGSEVVDLLTGKRVPVDAQGNIKLEIEPGDGKILFLSPTGSGEGQKLIHEYGL